MDWMQLAHGTVQRRIPASTMKIDGFHTKGQTAGSLSNYQLFKGSTTWKILNRELCSGSCKHV
jgi:hypothetical protein